MCLDSDAGSDNLIVNLENIETFDHMKQNLYAGIN